MWSQIFILILLYAQSEIELTATIFNIQIYKFGLTYVKPENDFLKPIPF